MKAHDTSLEQRLHDPYMIDDLFHTLLNLCGIETSTFNPSRSFFNPEYDSTRTRILENGGLYSYTK